MENINLSKQAKELKLGKYMHFKGQMHEVLGVGVHTETLEEFVVYKHLAGENPEQIFIRPLSMFIEQVDKPELNYNGPRFKYIGN